jgi:hypothetical protein
MGVSPHMPASHPRLSVAEASGVFPFGHENDRLETSKKQPVLAGWQLINRVHDGDGGCGSSWIFELEERLKELSAKANDLERLTAWWISSFERAAPGSDGSKGGWPRF